MPFGTFALLCGSRDLAPVSYYYLFKFFNQISRSSCGIFSANALKIRLIQNLCAPCGSIKTFRN